MHTECPVVCCECYESAMNPPKAVYSEKAAMKNALFRNLGVWERAKMQIIYAVDRVSELFMQTRV